MADPEKAKLVLENALAEWRKRETLKRERTSISRFADYLGYSQQAVSFWLNGTNPISDEAINKMAPKLAELLGERIYDELQLKKPDLLLDYVTGNWETMSKEKKEKIAKLIEQDTKRPIPNEPKTRPTKP
jgi:transcriptional regulator with XRE-family HTH domain